MTLERCSIVMSEVTQIQQREGYDNNTTLTGPIYGNCRYGKLQDYTLVLCRGDITISSKNYSKFKARITFPIC